MIILMGLGLLGDSGGAILRGDTTGNVKLHCRGRGDHVKDAFELKRNTRYVSIFCFRFLASTTRA